jgi:hypothetical protein
MNTKGFIVLKKLKTESIEGYIVSEDYDLKQIEKELANASISKELSHIHIVNEDIYLVLHCREKGETVVGS